MDMPYQDVVKGKWTEFMGKAKKIWGKLTDDHWMQAKGDAEQLAGILQQEYEWSKEDARKAVQEFVDKNFRDSPPTH